LIFFFGSHRWFVSGSKQIQKFRSGLASAASPLSYIAIPPSA
jgi:hypothetical protein